MSHPFYQRYENPKRLQIMKPKIKSQASAIPYSEYLYNFERKIFTEYYSYSFENHILCVDTKSSPLCYNGEVFHSLDDFIQINNAKHLTFEDIIHYLSSQMNFAMEFERGSHKHEYFDSKNLWVNMNAKYFHKFIDRLLYIMNNSKNVEKIVLQIGWETMYSLSEIPEDELERAVDEKYYFNSFGIGTLVNMNNFFARFILAFNENDVKMVFKHMARDRYDYQVELIILLSESLMILRIVWKISSIKKIIFQNLIGFTRVFFELSCFPIFYTCRGVLKDFYDVVNVVGKEKKWVRVNEFLCKKNVKEYYFNANNVGCSKTIYLDFCGNDSQRTLYDLFSIIIDKLYCFNGSVLRTYASKIDIINQCFSSTIISKMLDFYRLPFNFHYGCLVLFSSDMKCLDMMAHQGFLEEFFEKLSSVAAVNNQLKNNQFLEMIYQMTTKINQFFLIDITKEFRKAFDNYYRYHYKRHLNNCDIFRIAEIYPSHIKFLPPKLFLQSRISKIASADHILRIKLNDDGGFGFGFGSKIDKTFSITSNMNHILTGITIKDRVHKFLGSSPSQMKEYSATLYAMDDNGNDTAKIRHTAGTFEGHSVSKFVSRFGLMFSQSLSIFELKCFVSCLEDVNGTIKPKSRYDSAKIEPYCLSDGIGYISTSIYQKFHEELNKSHCLKDYVPSAYQIRYAGYKGMLSHNPNAKREGIFFRKSMQKFNSSGTDVCLLKYSYPRATMLNRPLIMILDDAHKIEPFEFYKIFQENTHLIAQASSSDDNATLFLRRINSVIKWDKIHKAEISILEEPFLKSVLQHSMIYRLREDIKRKERLSLSPNIARCAFGIVDETKTLKPGQVFFQATKMDEEKTVYPKETFVLKGSVMVFRNPVMQPGDVRKFEAIDIPGLHHIKDCVVFPLVGIRSHADELSGGDYDGDEFVIVWNSEFVVKQNFPPMDFPYGQGTKTSNENFSEADMIKFYCKYFEKQSIGYFANLHMKIADYHPSGLKSDFCEQLCNNYNIMLDSSKTDFFDVEKLDINLKHDPDFMTTSKKQNQYLSHKMLGKLHRQCDLLEEVIKIANSSFEICKAKAKLLKDQSGKKLIKNRLTLPNWDVYRELANEAFQIYKMRINNILVDAEISEESILFSNCYKHTESTTFLQLENLIIDFESLFEKQTNSLKLGECEQHFLTSAWYTICLDQPFIFNNNPLLGLPWLILDKVCKLACFVKEQEQLNSEKLSFGTIIKDGIISFQPITAPAVISTDSFVQIAKNGCKISSKYIKLSFKSWQIRKDHLKILLWRSTIIEDFFDDSNQKIYKTFYTVLANSIKTIAFDLIMNLFKKINKEIYFFTHHMNIFFDSRFVEHDELLKSIVWDLISKLLSEHLLDNVNLPTVSSLLNIFMLYLHNLVSNINPILDDLISDSKQLLSDVILFKYGVFALIFVNKLDIRHESEYIEKVNLQFMNNLCSEPIEDEAKMQDLFVIFKEKLQNYSSIFETVLNAFFTSELQNNKTYFKSSKEEFFLLPKCDFWKNNILFLNFITGCKKISIQLSNHGYPDYNFYRPTYCSDKLSQVRAVGYPISLCLLRTILGNSTLINKVPQCFQFS